MKCVWRLVLFCGLCLVVTMATEPGKTIFTNIKPLVGKKAIEEFKKEPQIRVIYYYKPEYKNRYKLFLKELDKSVEFVELYNVKMCMVDCSNEENKDVAECGKAKTERNVFTYRGGMQLLQLELETMFDVNSIMSNLLQLVLLREVPIFQSSKEVQTFLSKQRGKQDVIFGYMKAIGTFDHRVFMEVAYAYQSKMKFAICTNKQATDVFDEPVPSTDLSTIWWVWTRDQSPEEKHYGSLQYKGARNLAELARFVKYITKPAIYSVPSDGMTHNYDGSDLNLLNVYYKPNRMAEVFNVANIISKNFKALLGITAINMDDGQVQKQYTVDRTLPAVGLIRKGETEELFFDGDFHLEFLFRFLEDNIVYPVSNPNSVRNTVNNDEDIEEEDSEMDGQSEEYFNDIDEVERQDDKVDFSVMYTKRKPMKLDLVPALTDKTFNKTVSAGLTAVVLFYLPFTSMNNVNLRYFGEAGDRLGEQTTLKVARVNCYDWTDVCAEQSIGHYPTIRVFKKGQVAWDYKGPQDPQEMFSMMKILEMSSPRKVDDPVEVMNYLTGQGHLDISMVTKTTVVGLFDKKSSKEMEVFQTVADQSRDRIMFVYMDTTTNSKQVAGQFGRELPCVILSKFDDTIQSHAVFEEQYSVDNMHNFVQQNKLPKLTVLTPLMFPELRKQGDSMVILFTDDSTDSTSAKDDLREMVKSQRFSNVSFTMLPTPVSDESSVAYKVLKTYTEEPAVPFLSFVDFKKGLSCETVVSDWERIVRRYWYEKARKTWGEVFNFGPPSTDRQNVVEWLGSVVRGTTEPSIQLANPEWKPLNKGFEFLKIMDYEQEQERKKKMKMKENGDNNVESNIAEQVEEEKEEATQSTMEDTLDSDTRKDLFNSRLYHQAPARIEQQKTTHSHDEL